MYGFSRNKTTRPPLTKGRLRWGSPAPATPSSSPMVRGESRKGLAVPISIPRKTKREAAEIISPVTRFAISIPSAVFPDAVGPTITINLGNALSIQNPHFWFNDFNRNDLPDQFIPARKCYELHLARISKTHGRQIRPVWRHAALHEHTRFFSKIRLILFAHHALHNFLQTIPTTAFFLARHVILKRAARGRAGPRRINRGIRNI